MAERIRKISELRDIEVLLISLVDKGANNKKLFYKSASQQASNWDKVVKIVKTDEEKRLVYCIVYSPDEEDAHGHFATEKEVEKACHRFMKRSNTHSVDEQHNMEVAKNVYIVESWIVKENDEYFPDDKGAWAVCIKVENDEVWEKVKSGEYEGISMYGFAKIIEKNKTGLTKLKEKVAKFFDELSDTDYAEDMGGLEKSEQLVKDFNESYAKNTLYNVVNAMCDALWGSLYGWDGTGATDAERITALVQSSEQFKAKLAEIESGLEVSKEFKKAGKVLSSANLTKLQTAIDNLQEIHTAASGEEVKKQSLLEKLKSTEMTKEEIQKEIDAKLKPVIEKNTELVEKNAKLEEDLKAANEKIEKLEKSSPGSKQEETPGGGVKKVKKGMFVVVPDSE
ncbi:MAG: hypothetical protein K1X86_15500 [Ignavibacteria bacterium]|nr:hypothetical protein [Ignavibacteria bacterium]